MKFTTFRDVPGVDEAEIDIDPASVVRVEEETVVVLQRGRRRLRSGRVVEGVGRVPGQAEYRVAKIIYSPVVSDHEVTGYSVPNRFVWVRDEERIALFLLSAQRELQGLPSLVGIEDNKVYSPPYRPKRVRENRKRGREALKSIWQ